MGLGVTYGGMPPFFVFRGQRIFDGYLSILGGIGPRNRVREERMGARVLLFFNPEGCE